MRACQSFKLEWDGLGWNDSMPDIHFSNALAALGKTDLEWDTTDPILGRAML
jgi:hypothetical protein